jgi:ribosome-associated protein
MSMPETVIINDRVQIPDDELTFTTSRSSGPGGQNVNKVNTRVTLLFDVERSPSLSDDERRLLYGRLAGRINKEGVLRVVAQRHRTQAANRDAAMHRFAELLRTALTPEEVRVPSVPSRAANERRLQQKKLRSRLKQERSKPLY